MRWVALVLALLLSSPAGADMFQDGSNAKFPAARDNLGTGACDPVAEFNADPGGAADSTAAINACLALNAHRQNVRLPVGNYKITGEIVLQSGQTLSGAGRATTQLIVDQGFSPTATGVVVMNTGGIDSGAEIRDIGFYFYQPDTQGSRAAFQNLGACTHVAGGTGCKYPPAIRLNGARPKVRNVRIARAWKGIVSTSAAWLDTIEVSALDTGLEAAVAADVLDWGHFRGIHFWPFDIINGTNLYNVFADGQTIAAKFGSQNGANINDFASLHGRFIIDGPLFWGDINNLSLDSAGSRLEILRNAFPGVRITNFYTSGAPGGAVGTCKVSIGAGNTSVQIANSMLDGVETEPLFCVSAGRVSVTGSAFLTNTASQKAVVETGGVLALKNNNFMVNTAFAWTNPLVDVAAGTLIAVGNTFPVAGTNVGGINLAADDPGHYLADNNTKVWPAAFGFSLGGTVLGYYDLGDQPIGLSPINATFETPGNAALTNTAAGGFYYLRGDYAEGGLDMTFNSNAFTTASGPFRIKTPNMPLAKTGLTYGCNIHLMSNVMATTSTPTCVVDNFGFLFAKVVAGAAATALSTTEIPPSWGGMGFRLGWRYRIR